uniref:RING-type domain-containing protein n=1 Tax=viral metagenome TaxID=1070528 RepID=A0A6C0DF47_9ZZZZ
MSERDFYNRRLNRLNLLNNNDRFILNIYVEMYNQYQRDIDMMYQEIEMMYDNMNELRNIINVITGVTDMIDERNRERARVRSRDRSYGDESENTRRQRRRTDNGDSIYDNIRDIFHSTHTNRNTGYERRTTPTIPNIFQRLYGQQTNNRTNVPSGRAASVGLGDFLLNFYDTVPVYPTQQQINNGTRRVLYSNIDNPLNSSCPITLENFDDSDNVTQILGCGHIFNHDSLTSWFRNHVRCPVCRYDIRNYVPRSQPLIQEINTSRRPSPDRYQEQENEGQDEGEEEESKQEESAVNNSATEDTQSSGGTTLHTATSAYTNEQEPEQSNNEGSLMNNLTNITENLIQSLLNNNRQSGSLYNEIVYNLPYIDPSSNDIVFEGYIQNNFRL